MSGKYKPETDTDNFFIEIYPFLDRFQLRAVVSRKTHLYQNEENLRMQQALFIEYLGKEGEILDGRDNDCLQVVVTSATLEEIDSIPPKISEEEYILGGVPIEKLPEIQLAPSEQFFALKSWVQGIAEAGMDLFTDFDTYLEYPAYFRMIYPLFGMVVRHTPSMIPHYLTMVERKCKFEGKWHVPSLLSLLDPILKVLYPLPAVRYHDDPSVSDYSSSFNPMTDPYNKTLFEGYPENLWKDTFDALIALEFPLDVYCKILPYVILKKHFRSVPGYEETLLDSDFMLKYLNDPDIDVTKYITPAYLSSSNPELVEFVLKKLPKPYTLPEYRKLFDTKSPRIEYLLAEEPEAAKFPEYRNLFQKAIINHLHNRGGILGVILRNDNAIDLPEYQDLVNVMKKDPDSGYFDCFRDSSLEDSRPYFFYFNKKTSRIKFSPKFRKVLEELLPYWEKVQKRKWEEALDIAGQLRGLQRRAVYFSNRGSDYKARGDYNAALKDYREVLETYEEALDIGGQLGDLQGKAACLNNIGSIYKARGDYDNALKNYTEALKIAEQLGDLQNKAVYLNNIGLIYKARGDYEAALVAYEEALRIDGQMGDLQNKAVYLNNIGQIYDARGDYDTALKNYEEALKIDGQLGNLQNKAIYLNNIGKIYYTRGDYDNALKTFKEATELNTKLGDRHNLASSKWWIATVLEKQGKRKEALLPAQEALGLYRQLGFQNEVKRVEDFIKTLEK